MDVLDKYKETWKNQPDEINKVSQVDIYKMAHKKSTSIVKWIFIIGIIEFVLFLILGFVLEANHSESQQDLPRWARIAITIFSYAVSIYFIFYFYKNHKEISTSSNTKMLMESILKTRKTVKKFIKFNLMLVLVSIVVKLIYVTYTGCIKGGNISEGRVEHIILPILTLFLLIPFFYLIKFYYHLLYGRLLDKLYVNYNELSRLESE